MEYKVVESDAPRITIVASTGNSGGSSQGGASFDSVPSRAIPVAQIKTATPTKPHQIQIVALKPSPLKQQFSSGGGSHLLNAVQQRIPVSAVPVQSGQQGHQVLYYTTSGSQNTSTAHPRTIGNIQGRVPTITLTRPAIVTATPLIALTSSQVIHQGQSQTQQAFNATTLVAPPHPANPPAHMVRTVSALQGHPGQPSNWKTAPHWSPPNHQLIAQNQSHIVSSSGTSTGTSQITQAITVDNDHDEDSKAVTSKLNSSNGGTGDGTKKPCHCNKSQCLKLYCECFAAGEFCSGCNCQNCANNLEHEDERNKAIKQCLERNPTAFHPKLMKSMAGKDLIGERRQSRGCNCKRSGCWKNYCECYEAKVACTPACKCVGCRNCPEAQRGNLASLNISGSSEIGNAATTHHHGTRGHHDSTHVSSSNNNHHRGSGQQTHVGTLYDRQLNKQLAQKSRLAIHHNYQRQPSSSSTGIKLPHKLFTPEVIEATCACLLAVADETSEQGASGVQNQNVKNALPKPSNLPDPVFTERAILEEFGRCLAQIIEVAYRPITSGAQTAALGASGN